MSAILRIMLAITLASVLCGMLIEAVAKTDHYPFTPGTATGEILLRPAATRGRALLNAPANAARPLIGPRGHRPAGGVYFRSVRAWRNAGSPVVVQPVSHRRDGSMIKGTANAWGDR